MSWERIAGVIVLCAGITYGLRALPFLVFRNGKEMPEWLIRLGNMLPSAIMAVLVVYCLKEVPGDFMGSGIRQLAAVVVVALSYWWKHNTFVSIVLGTGCYMLLLRI